MDEETTDEYPQDTAPKEQKDQEPLDEEAQLKDLTANVRDQDEIERDVAQQADRMLVEQANERDRKRLEKTSTRKDKLFAQRLHLEQRLSQPAGPSLRARLEAEMQGVQEQIVLVDDELKEIQERIDHRETTGRDVGSATDASGNRRLPNESRRDFLIRTGKITPFSSMRRTGTTSGTTLQEVMLNAEEGDSEPGEDEEEQEATDVGPTSHRNLRLPGFGEDLSDSSVVSRARKRRRSSGNEDVQDVQSADQGTRDAASEDTTSEDEYMPSAEGVTAPKLKQRRLELASPDESESEGVSTSNGKKRRRKRGTHRDRLFSGGVEKEDLRGLDDGNEGLYQKRLTSWVERRRHARERHQESNAGSGNPNDENGEMDGENGVIQVTHEEEWFRPHPTSEDVHFHGGLKVPGDIYPSLFDYQKTGTQWLWELYAQQVGGIIGDEMGLGKTIQVISFLAGLHYSKKLTKPIIVVTPATVMKQWVNEFHRWWPPFRVSILHSSGSGMLNVKGEERMEEKFETGETYRRSQRSTGNKGAARIVDTVVQKGHVLVTTYAGLQTYGDLLIPIDWEYAILDEGHKIRNPNTSITIYCKELRTPNRIILSGTPMQNNLTELWSLFDFVFPMRLGTLVNFRNQFDIPIRIGGYANASNLQVQTAIRCAETLKDAISPYLLQRLKVDVASDLPRKSEQVLFCKLTKPQRQAYESYLSSDDVRAIMGGSLRSFAGIEKLRKICNHPDLVDRDVLQKKAGYNYGNPNKSGKMQVVKALLELWKNGGHKTLLFAQQKIVLDILQKFLVSLEGLNFRRMDGETPIETRQSLVDEFNRDQDIHVFLLTTKVGGLGINLTGADRVIIFDPDWNPSTDTQARERAWRLGQKREVTIYRLMTAGTIEEKIYHRQLFKQFLANKILKDPKQRQTLPMKDLYDLFTLGSDGAGETETGGIFQGAETRLHNGQSKGLTIGPAPATADKDPNPKSAQETTEVEELAGVAGHEEFYEDGQKNEKKSADDHRVLEGILAGSGVHSALEHDEVVNGKKVVKGDPKMIEREAKKVAAEAAKQLRKAGEAAKNVPIGTPTWTGQFGVSGRPVGPSGAGRGHGGPSSASILAGLQNRPAAASSHVNGVNTNVGEQSSRSGTPTPQGQDFMKLIRDYMLVHGGQVRSQMLVDHFNRQCRTLQQTAEFKEMLKQIATLERAGQMRGKWLLKPEFR